MSKYSGNHGPRPPPSSQPSSAQEVTTQQIQTSPSHLLKGPGLTRLHIPFGYLNYLKLTVYLSIVDVLYFDVFKYGYDLEYFVLAFLGLVRYHSFVILCIYLLSTPRMDIYNLHVTHVNYRSPPCDWSTGSVRPANERARRR